MTDTQGLQDAIKRWDSERSEDVIRRIRSTSNDVGLFVEAARLVADPNLKAALAMAWRDGRTTQQIVRDIVAAALTPGDPE